MLSQPVSAAQRAPRSSALNADSSAASGRSQPLRANKSHFDGEYNAIERFGLAFEAHKNGVDGLLAAFLGKCSSR